MALQLGLLQLLEGVWTQFVIGLLGLEHVVDDDKRGMRDGDQGLVDATATGEAAEPRTEEVWLRALAQATSQSW
jgi:hypothetical protein